MGLGKRLGLLQQWRKKGGPWTKETSAPTRPSAQLLWDTGDTLQPAPPDGPSLLGPQILSH